MRFQALPRAALVALLAALAACGSPATAPPPPSPSASSVPSAAPEALTFTIDAGELDNHFFRRGPVAAHVLAASGRFPRVLFAFPAGNTGAGLWFEPLDEPAHVTVSGSIAPVERAGGLRGVSAVVRTDAPSLRVRGAVLGSIRALRQYAGERTVPEGFAPEITPGDPIVVSRTLLDGRHVVLEIAPEEDATVALDASGRVVAAAGPGERGFALRFTALTDEDPLTPIDTPALLTAAAVADPQSRDALAFLTDREKLLAGSWRFLTYFGRDTLISLQLLLPVLAPAPIEAGLGSVLDRLGPAGEVAHEEAIGEWAVLENRRRGAGVLDERAPVYDYTMVDDDFLLAPVLARYLLDTPAGRGRAAAFLARRTTAGATYRAALRSNLARVLALAEPFAASGDARDLVALKPGVRVGDWRDSETGLGGGRVPYDVNAALVPAALEAAARLGESPVLDLDPTLAARARAYAAAWRAAVPIFRVEIPEAEARARVSAYAATEGLDAAPALASIHGPVAFDALALDAAGAPVPVLHSDVAFRWLYDDPPPHVLEESARRIFAPFPAGLLTPVGVLVANPAYAADPALQATFTRHDYHGTVVWSWQQALLAAGIDRQLARRDLPRSARRALEDAEVALWKVIRGTQAVGMSTAELWSFRVEDGRYALVPFGEGHGDADESNAVQLWSTVYLSVRPSWARKEHR